MPTNVIMPALGMAQETGTLLTWLIEEGAAVIKGKPLMEVATDKTDMEVEAPATGILVQVTARPGDEIPVGETIALILAEGEAAPTLQTAAKAGVQPEVSPTEPQVSPVAARMAAEHNVDLGQIPVAGKRIQKQDVQDYLDAQQSAPPRQVGPGSLQPASPKARRLAQEAGHDLADIPGSGPGGAVLADDVLAYQPAKQLPHPAPHPAPASVQAVEALPVSRMWQIMAQRLTESWTSVPHFYLTRQIDATDLMAWRKRANARSAVKLTVTDLLTRAVAAALAANPQMNVSWLDGNLVQHASVNVGLAVAVEGGLLVPVIHGADGLSLAQIARRRGELVERALAGKLAPNDMQDGTFTISNLGMYGVDGFSAIVNPPQAGILAVGRIADRVVAVDGSPRVRPMMTLTLSCDHRAVDGAGGARFLQTVTQFLEDPLSILE